MVTQNMLRKHEGKKGLFGEKNVTALDLMKCLEQIKWQIASDVRTYFWDTF